jgi:hypothetical protein
LLRVAAGCDSRAGDYFLQALLRHSLGSADTLACALLHSLIV